MKILLIAIWGFSLCSFISYAGCSEEANARCSEEISFNKSNSLPATEAPSRFFGSKKKNTDTHIGGRRTQLIRVNKSPGFDEGMFNAGKHVVEVVKVNQQFTALKKTEGKVELAAWLPIAIGEKKVNMNHFKYNPEQIKEGDKLEFSKSETNFGQRMILKTNAPFFMPSKTNREKERPNDKDYWEVLIKKFNNLPNNYSALKKRNLRIKVPKYVRLEVIKGSCLKNEKKKMAEVIKGSALHWDAYSLRLLTYAPWAYDEYNHTYIFRKEQFYIAVGWDKLIGRNNISLEPDQWQAGKHYYYEWWRLRDELSHHGMTEPQLLIMENIQKTRWEENIKKNYRPCKAYLDDSLDLFF